MEEKPTASNLSLNWYIQIYHSLSLGNLDVKDQQRKLIRLKQSNEIKRRNIGIIRSIKF